MTAGSLDGSMLVPGFTTRALHAGGSLETTDLAADARPQTERPTALPSLAGRDPGEDVTLLEERLASLEGGTAAIATSTGASAPLLVLHALLDREDEVLVAPATFAFLEHQHLAAVREFAWRLTAVDPSEPEVLGAAISPRTRAIVIESLSPSGELRDIAAIAAAAERAGVPLVVDNTLASPYLLQPICHGANIVVHASAAALAGTAAASGGFVIEGGNFDWSGRDTKLTRPRADLAGRSIGEQYGNFAVVTAIRASGLSEFGPDVASLDAFLTLNGLETLALRIQRQSDSALAIAAFLATHAAVESVDYAGLPTHRSHALHRRCCPEGSGPVLGLRLRAAGAVGDVRRSLQLFAPSGPAGGTRSCLTGEPADDRRTLVLSVGLEDAADLLADLDEALAGLRL